MLQAYAKSHEFYMPDEALIDYKPEEINQRIKFGHSKFNLKAT
jgi:hypothetical protein